jgi:hypothetical protein
VWDKWTCTGQGRICMCIHKNYITLLRVVVYNCNASTEKAEAGGSWVPDQLGIHSESCIKKLSCISISYLWFTQLQKSSKTRKTENQIPGGVYSRQRIVFHGRIICCLSPTEWIQWTGLSGFTSSRDPWISHLSQMVECQNAFVELSILWIILL